MQLSVNVPSSKRPSTNWICLDLTWMCVCVCACYQTMWQTADVTVCVVAQTPGPFTPSPLLSLSLSPSRLRQASRKQTDVKQKAPPFLPPHSLSAFVCLSLSLNDSCVWIDRQICSLISSNRSMSMSVYDWEESFNHMQKCQYPTVRCPTFSKCLQTFAHDITSVHFYQCCRIVIFPILNK